MLVFERKISGCFLLSSRGAAKSAKYLIECQQVPLVTADLHRRDKRCSPCAKQTGKVPNPTPGTEQKNSCNFMPHYIPQKAFTWCAASRAEQGQGFSAVPFKPAHEEWSELAFVCILQGVKKGKCFFYSSHPQNERSIILQ